MVEQIGRRDYFWVSLCGVRNSSACLSGGDVIQVHQASHPFPAATYSFSPQGSMDTRAAIGLSAQLVFFADLNQEVLVGLRPPTFRTATPGVVPTATHAQHPAHAIHSILAFMGNHKLVLHMLVREKMFTTFFRISRSSSTSANFRCKRRISALAASRSLGSR